MNVFWSIPFAGILLSIAILPLLIPQIWHHHYGKIIAAWTFAFLAPALAVLGFADTLHIVGHAIFEEYIPFLLLLLTLYTVSGGILVWGDLPTRVSTNMLLLIIGTLCASVMGTTGAAMLLIRPLLRANEARQYQIHTVVFFIILVANIGGGLTPLGDPPLFLGFLKGVDFLWALKYMLLPVVFNSAMLLAMFFVLDCYLFRKEKTDFSQPKKHPDPIKIYGKINFLFLAMVIASVLFSGLWQSGVHFEILGAKLRLEAIIRDCLLLLITYLSLRHTATQVRAGNEFNWEPIREVGKLFLGIFICITPVLTMLKAGANGPFQALIALLHTADGEANNHIYFWLTGLLSAFLDNAPTYLLFFNIAASDAAELMQHMPTTLLAISMGSVFMGALSYIGNAPNFMVKAIAEQRQVLMPSFFAYMLTAFAILTPLFILNSWLFLR